MSKRIDKVNELLKEEVSSVMLRELADHEGFITVTAVETTRDMRQAFVWVSVIGIPAGKALKLLTNKEKAIQAVINHRMNAKHVPKLNFKIDASGSYADKINQLIKEANSEEPRS